MRELFVLKNPAWNLKGKSLPGNREKGRAPLALLAGKKSLLFPFIKASVIYEIRGRPLSKDVVCSCDFLGPFAQVLGEIEENQRKLRKITGN